MPRLNGEVIRRNAPDYEEPIFNGTYVIGTEMKSGTYVSKGNDGGCYWEIAGKNGDIIKNSFSNGPRQQVTIPRSAYAFTTDGCVGWVRQR